MIGEQPPGNNDGEKGADVISFEEALAKKRNKNGKEAEKTLNENEKNKIICDLLDYHNAFVSKLKPEIEEIICWLNEKEKLTATNYARFKIFLLQTEEFIERNFTKKEQNDFQRAKELDGLVDFFSSSFFITKNQWEEKFEKHFQLMEQAKGEEALKQAVRACLKKLEFNQVQFSYADKAGEKAKMLKDFIEKNETE